MYTAQTEHLLSTTEEPTPKINMLQAGHLFAERYEILAVRGQGGMGVVYKARHILLRRLVAIKLLSCANVSEYDLKRFEQEARSASHLSHPNIVDIHDFGITADSQAYLVMDYLDGPSLEDVLLASENLPLPRFLHIFSQTCRALQHAHSRGVIHRDVKASNIMLIESDEQQDIVKLVDFGLAKLTIPERGPSITKSGVILGSPLFMSPEMCRGLKVDLRCDIYSLGCLMYKAVSGQYPFVGESAMDTMLKHINDPPLPFSDVAPRLTIPPSLETVILRAMEKDPDARQSSMKELEAQLQEAIAPFLEAPASKSQAAAAVRIEQRKKSPKKATWRPPDKRIPHPITLVLACLSLTAMAFLAVPLVLNQHKASESPPLTGSQMILDPGFEEQHDNEISSPWATEGGADFGIDRATNNRHSGLNNAWIRTRKKIWSEIHQDVLLKSHSSYSLSVWLRDSGTFTEGKLGVRDGNGKILSELSFSKLPAYTQLQLDFQCEEETRAQVFAGFHGLGRDAWLQVDDFSLTSK
jgi:serine/threonine protein kinase